MQDKEELRKHLKSIKKMKTHQKQIQSDVIWISLKMIQQGMNLL